MPLKFRVARRVLCQLLDTAGIDRAGLAPIRPLLAEIDAIESPTQLAQWQGRKVAITRGTRRNGVVSVSRDGPPR